jgi:hypothetical protein
MSVWEALRLGKGSPRVAIVNAFAVLQAMVVGLAILPPAALAQQGITAEGITDCASWVTSRTAGRAEYLEHYLLGLLNGLALGSGIEFWRAGGVKVSREQAYLWMDNYCRNNPLSNPITGAFALMNERTGNALARYGSARQ